MIRFNQTKIGYIHELFSIDQIELKSGFLYCLIGSNGAGKTTLLETITGEINSFKGEVLVNSNSIQKLKRNEKSKIISFVNSKFDGVDFLKVYNYIALGRTPYTNFLGRLTKQDKKIINQSIQSLNIQRLSEKFTNEISDGEKQMASIARALTQETDIIILDEPTAFLDYANRKLVMLTLQKIAKELNKCILVSTHDLDLCLEVNAEILIINKKVKKLELFSSNQLTKEEIIEKGFYPTTDE